MPSPLSWKSSGFAQTKSLANETNSLNNSLSKLAKPVTDYFDKELVQQQEAFKTERTNNTNSILEDYSNGVTGVDYGKNYDPKMVIEGKQNIDKHNQWSVQKDFDNSQSLFEKRIRDNTDVDSIAYVNGTGRKAVLSNQIVQGNNINKITGKTMDSTIRATNAGSNASVKQSNLAGKVADSTNAEDVAYINGEGKRVMLGEDIFAKSIANNISNRTKV